MPGNVFGISLKLVWLKRKL